MFQRNWDKLTERSNEYMSLLSVYKGFGWLKSHSVLMTGHSFVPFLVMVSASLLFISIILMIVKVTSLTIFLFLLALACLVTFFSLWMLTLSMEGEYPTLHTTLVQRNYLTGMVIFIASEVMLFVGFFWAFFSFSLVPSIFVGGVWPPVSIVPLSIFSLPLINTLLLLTSGITMNAFYYSLNSLNVDAFPSVQKFSLEDFADILDSDCASDEDLISLFMMQQQEAFLTNVLATSYYLAINSEDDSTLDGSYLWLTRDGSSLSDPKYDFEDSLNRFFPLDTLAVEGEESLGSYTMKSVSTLYGHEEFQLSDISASDENSIFGENFEETNESEDFADLFLFEQLSDPNFVSFNFYTLCKNISFSQMSQIRVAPLKGKYTHFDSKLQEVLNSFWYSLDVYHMLLLLALTIFLGVLFLIFQFLEYTVHATFGLGNLYGSVFFFTTGLHGMHVFIGLVSLIVTLIRLIRGKFIYNFSPHTQMTCIVWYWHFVDIVWLFLFFFVYIWGM